MKRHALCVTLLVMVLNIAVASPSVSQETSPSDLVRFDDCGAFLDHVKTEALARVGPYGFGAGRSYLAWDVAEAAAAEAEAAAAAAEDTATKAPVAGVDYSTTNVQEAGVDEPDIVKTDGRRIVAVSGGVLYHIDVAAGDPSVVATYDLWPWTNSFGSGWRLPESELFLRGDTALVMMSGDSYALGGAREPKTRVVQFDLAEPSVVRVERSLSIDGRLVSARLVGDRASLVVSSQPRIDREFVYPATRFESSMSRAARANRNAIRESTLEHWVPGYEIRTRDSAGVRGTLVDCSATFAPQEFSGFGLLSVLNFDLSENIGAASVAGVLAGGDTVYASSERLYVASRRWIDRDDFDAADAGRITTHIHRFDVSGPDGPVYEASGAVNGLLLNQFAMSEHDGHLRVASTDLPVWGWWRTGGTTSESRVDVLERDGGRLRVVGSVKGLGRGERIFAVRFIGEMGYVVTFRQVDPLYTIDLSDPADPQVLGELKIPGYSAYLHPIGEDLVLGVGQDADPQGRLLGTQVSIFDVSDPANPQRTHQYKLPRYSRTEVEFNHRAFLHWPQTGLAVLPVGWWGYKDGSGEWESYHGALALRVGSEGIERLGTIEHELDGEALKKQSGYYRWMHAPIRRSLVIGDELFTLSDAGLKGSDLASLADTSWTRFPSRPTPYVY